MAGLARWICHWNRSHVFSWCEPLLSYMCWKMFPVFHVPSCYPACYTVCSCVFWRVPLCSDVISQCSPMSSNVFLCCDVCSVVFFSVLSCLCRPLCNHYSVDTFWCVYVCDCVLQCPYVFLSVSVWSYVLLWVLISFVMYYTIPMCSCMHNHFLPFPAFSLSCQLCPSEIQPWLVCFHISCSNISLFHSLSFLYSYTFPLLNFHLSFLTPFLHYFDPPSFLPFPLPTFPSSIPSFFRFTFIRSFFSSNMVIGI